MSNRHTVARLSFAAIIAIVGLSLSMVARAQSGETISSSSASSTAPTGNGMVTIEQKSSFDDTTMGNWTLLLPSFEEIEGDEALYTSPQLAAGSYTLIVTPPSGVTTSIRIYDGLTQLQYVQRQQISFKLADGQTLGIIINYSLTHIGTVSVQSDPPGIDFTLDGPNDIRESGTTPMSYEGYPIGQYTAKFTPPKDCGTPPPKTDQLLEGGRVSFSLTLSCESADKLRSREETKDDHYVVITVDGEDVTLYDVPQDSWFSSFVFNAARLNVINGYRDENGKPTGEFGPGNNVTIAELAKMAHRLGGVSEESFIGRNPENASALGQWFSAYIASAEARGWRVYQDTTIDPLRPATRGEVIATFLQALDKPLNWPKGNLFTDVGVRTPYANAIETAATDDIVSGRTDESGHPLHLFGPGDPINRAEIAKIIDKVFEIYKGIDDDD